MRLFEAEQLTKSYGGIPALAGVSIELRSGEIHALAGENGAGKSTLAKIVCGLTRADSGSMQLDGSPFAPSSKLEAEKVGIRVVLQELNLISTLTVAENLFLRRMPVRLGAIDYRNLNERARELLGRFGLEQLDPRTTLQALGVGVRQMLEIAAALSEPCRLLILDEPTAALSGGEAENLFGHLDRLKGEGVAIVYISHRMEEIHRISDRITVLRDGALVETSETDKITPDEVVRLMVGRDLSHEVWLPKTLGETALRVSNLRSGNAVRGVDFELKEGEILGVAGLVGSGRTETVRAVFGADRPDGGEIELYGEPVRGTRDAVRRGLALLTEDRKEQGLLLPRPVRENISLTRLRSLASRIGWVRRAGEAAHVNSLVERLRVRCSSIEQPAQELSGGNQQKALLARWVGADSKALLVDEPTRGIDVGSKFEIYGLLNSLAAQGKAILIVSSDLLELMALCDRICVMSAGRIAATFARGEWTADKIMAAALSGYGAADVG